MKYFQNQEETNAINWMHEAAKVAQKALCLKAKCGSIIVKDGNIIGEGYNGPPLDNMDHNYCLKEKNTQGKPGYDQTCCMHAEWRAILDATKRNPDKINGSTLYFTRVDKENNITKSGEPLCTVCSRFAPDTGVKEFVLWHDQGVCVYPTDEYNNLSYSYISPEFR